MSRSAPAAEPDPARQWLSDLVDGRLRDDELGRACSAWADDAEAQRTWHAYHLIGDVLRSDDLARPGTADSAFLLAVRARLQAEPVVLAPAPAASPAVPRRRRQVWMMPIAAAAGFVAVAGVVVVLQQAAPLPGASAPQIAAGTPAVQPVSLPSSRAVVRDPRLDEFLNAHREAFAGSPAALPGGGVRTVGFDAPPQR